ncbi:MAG: glycosyltransferase family 9 protein [Pirellulaceae bacterium]
MPAPKRRSPRFLITRLSAIGDCILTMPVAAELRRTYPDSLIVWVVQGAGAQLLVDHPDLDQVIKVPRGWLKSPRAIWKLRDQLRQYNFDYVIDPQSLTKSSAAGWLSGASRRIGFSEPQGRELAPLLANHHVRRTADHVVDAYLQLLKPLGIHHPQVRFHVPRSSEATKMVDTFLDQVQPGPEFIVINPGAGWDSKLWPARRYGLLARELGRQHGIYSIVAWAGDRERSWTAEIVEHSGGHAIAAPDTTLPQLAALLRRATMFVGSDTGPLHLAAAVGTTCVSMYGPTRPSDCGPYGQQHIALQSYYQDGSARERRRAPNDAMQAIDVEQVAEACGRVLEKKEHSAA